MNVDVTRDTFGNLESVCVRCTGAMVDRKAKAVMRFITKFTETGGAGQCNRHITLFQCDRCHEVHAVPY